MIMAMMVVTFIIATITSIINTDVHVMLGRLSLLLWMLLWLGPWLCFLPLLVPLLPWRLCFKYVK